MDTQYAHFQGNPLYQATKRHLNSKKKTDKKYRKFAYCVHVKISVRLNLFVFGSCFRTLAVILFQIIFLNGGGEWGVGGINPQQDVRL